MSELIKNEYIKLYREFRFSVDNGSIALSDDQKRGYIFSNVATVRDADIYYGGSNYTAIGSNTSTFSSLSEYTFKVSFNYLPSNASQRILCLGSTKNKYQGIIVAFEISKVSVYFYYNNVANLIGTIPATANTWNNLIVDVKGDRLILSLNDYEDTVEFVSTSIVPNVVNSLHLATEAGGGNFAKGYISNVEFYNVSLYDTRLNKSFIHHNGEYKKYGTLVESNDNLVPIMNSNSNDDLSITSSSQYNADYTGWKAFNKDITTIGENGWEANTSTGWLQIEFKNKKIVNSYKIYPFNGSVNNLLNRAPKNWTFEGSNNGVDWTILDTRSNVTSWTTGIANVYNFNNTLPYSFYRINITSNNGGSYLAIMELELYGYKFIEQWFNTSSVLPTVEQFVTEGMDDLSVFNRQLVTLDPMQMTDVSDILPEGTEGKKFSAMIDLEKYVDIRSIKVEVK